MSRITISSTNILTTFSQAATRSNLTSGENLPISLGKISKFIATTPGLIVDSGTTTTYDSTTYTSGDGCEIFNYSNNKAAGNYSHAEGYTSKALGNYSHVECGYSVATGAYSHAEGYRTFAGNQSSHAEGYQTNAIGYRSHAEGMNTIASGTNSHAEGDSTTTSGNESHAEGSNTAASGSYSHSEGYYTTASGQASHAEGYYTSATMPSSHAEGYHTSATGSYSHASGYYTEAGAYQTVIGKCNRLLFGEDENYAFIIGNGSYDSQTDTVTRSNAFAVDWDGKIYVDGASTGVDVTTLPGEKVTAGTTVTYDGVTYTTGSSCEIFNDHTNNKSTGSYSHAEGYNTKALGTRSHAEGYNTVVTGSNAHAEGYGTTASGDHSHASGIGTIAASNSQTAIGSNNVSDANGTYAFIIGNGNSTSSRSNAFAIDWDGKVYIGNNGTGIDITTLAKTSDLYTDFTYQNRNLYKWKNSWGTVIFTSDSTPTSGSDNPVTSGGVYTAIANHVTIDDVYGGGTQIPSGADIDSATYRVPGVYYVASGGTGGDASNINGLPYTGTGGRLVVTSTGSANYVFQDYCPRTLGTNRSYRRFYNNGTWSEWADIRSLSGFYDNGVSLEPPSGTTIDLDTIGLGRFRVSSTSFASRIDNAPSDLSNKTYLIESGVTSTKGSNYYYQLIHPAGTADIIYKRVCIAGTWGEWATFRSDKYLKQLVDESDKNLVNPLKARGYSSQWSYFPITKGGITYTLNDNGSITTSGTATATTLLRIPVTLENGKEYVISGCPTGGSSSSYGLQIRKAGTNDYDAVVYGDSAIFTTSQTDYDVVIRYVNGTNANETFTPFVCPVSKWDVSSNIVPYKQNTVEITKALVDLIDNGPKNIIENRITSSTKNGITATTNADGSITISGKDSRTNPTSDFVLVNDLYNPSATTSFTSNIKADKMKTYICPATGNSNIRLQALGYNSSSDYATLASSDANVTFTPVRDYIVFRIFVKAGSDFTTNQFTLYPMICEKTAWDISQKFVPYRPSYQEMYERLVALENAT